MVCSAYNTLLENRSFLQDYKSFLNRFRKCLDKGGSSWAVLTDLSKAFDCIFHDLLIVELAAYGFDYQSLRVFFPIDSKEKQFIMGSIVNEGIKTFLIFLKKNLKEKNTKYNF